MKSFWLSLFCALTLSQAAPIDAIGALSVQNGKVVGANGKPAQLRGMSLFWSNANEGKLFYTAQTVEHLAKEWQVTLVRAAMGAEADWGEGQKGWIFDKSNQTRVETVVDAAIENGIYVIIDWHSHWSQDPSHPERLTAAVDFFTIMAQKYGSYPNVIWEVFNEPDTDNWSLVKNVNATLVETIRQYDPDNLIIVGTPKHSSQPDVAVLDPLKDSNGKLRSNVAYSFHFYASEQWHWDNYRAYAQAALDKGFALFVSEWGLSPASGDGSIDFSTKVPAWFQWMEDRQLSWAAWSICNKGETSAALASGVTALSGWTDSQLSAGGRWFRDKLTTLNPEWTAVGTGGTISAKASIQHKPIQIQIVNQSIHIQTPAGQYTHATLRSLDGKLLAQTPIRAGSAIMMGTTYQGVAFVQLHGSNTTSFSKRIVLQ